MQTHFSPERLKDPRVAAVEPILRKCVHCGFCTATCPTFTLLGDELDSPRGRIYLIKEMLEADRPADAETVKHVDRCLSCLSCMTTCPSGVNYMHLVDEARAHVEETFARPPADRAVRALLAAVLPHPGRFRLATRAARLARPLAPLLANMGEAGARLAAMLALAPSGAPRPTQFPQEAVKPAGARRARVAILGGCAQKSLRPAINDAAIRLLTRHGVEVVQPKDESCCGALVHHLGREEEAKRQARHDIDVWTREIEGEGLDAIVVTASGCGTVIKDYGYMFRDDPAYAAKAAKVSALAKDVTEFLASLKLAPLAPRNMVLAYHSACSMQHGQKITSLPKELLRAAGFEVRDPPEGHLCCGSAGTYNILQPEIASRLRERKIANIRSVAPDAVATGNIGCMTQIGEVDGAPALHTVELLDWAYGGEKPAEL